VAAERAVPYPPGIPVLLPGEVVTAGVVRALRRTLDGGGHVHGCADPALHSLAVVVPQLR
jgi:arginine/lysine/ornithine decarboxylase